MTRIQIEITFRRSQFRKESFQHFDGIRTIRARARRKYPTFGVLYRGYVQVGQFKHGSTYELP